MGDFNIKSLPRKYKAYLNKYTKAFCLAATKKAANILSKKMQQYIDRYYAEYDPIYYERTYKLKNKGFKKYLKKSGQILEGGVQLKSSYIQPAYKHEGYKNSTPLSTAAIYYRSVWLGQHGKESIAGYHYKTKYTDDGISIIKTRTDFEGLDFNKNNWSRWRPIIKGPSPYNKIENYLNNSDYLMKQCTEAGLKAGNKIPFPN